MVKMFGLNFKMLKWLKLKNNFFEITIIDQVSCNQSLFNIKFATYNKVFKTHVQLS